MLLHYCFVVVGNDNIGLGIQCHLSKRALGLQPPGFFAGSGWLAPSLWDSLGGEKIRGKSKEHLYL